MPEAALSRKAEDQLEERRLRYSDEIANIVEAAYKVIEATDSTDPSLRAILAEAGVSTPIFYRHFDSKDELLVLLLDDGRRQLAEYLKARLDRVEDPEAKVRAWVDGMMVQVLDSSAAHRTRPFFIDQGRLDRQYPAQQRESAQRLVEPLIEPISVLCGRAADDPLVVRHADAIYRLVTGAMRHHLTFETTPSKAERQHLSDFCLAGVHHVGQS
ncbi:TetR/AcrR family transcriptional regulator [Nocardioides sp.]|uniref:TetR/AcrR family transcriptional regulator n=1 Tax=Nocardioides sp. TaxID=35761 RepID=UPI003562BFE3